MKYCSEYDRILYLTLNSISFEVMVSGEKTIEYRRASNWILSRLSSKKGYDYIKFINGYGNKKPFFLAKYLGWEVHHGDVSIEEFSNGLKVNINNGTIKISIGEILERGNLN